MVACNCQNHCSDIGIMDFNFAFPRRVRGIEYFHCIIFY